SEATVQVMQRLAGAFHFAHTRARDLERAEGQRREAVQQASVDRVRAEIASMRTVADLDQITPLVGRELTALGVPFFRCAVFIVDEAQRAVQVYLATPEGRALASVRLAFESHPLVERVVGHWRQQTVLADRWDADQMEAWAGLLDAHALDPTTARGPDAPDGSLALLFAPFAQGMLFVGSADVLPPEDGAAVRALADAFAVAYARYDDYRQLEAKTVEVEKALADLRATQEQLVQSEKLASLGAVTAGIAHEIKNPLNFVNNFALLIAEIVDELSEDLAAGASPETLRETLDDLKTNAQTIARHGQRADGIVRGMLQHARGGKGLPEPVDFNALVEEHVALAYHGKRAQAPGLSVVVEGDYDPNAGQVVVVPQDIGRVLINLVNNAIDAVQGHAAAAGAPYTPTVRVQTVATATGVEVRVEDNGPGIRPEALARVFEPFFTTKPPGAGTGLGLSISHDIVAQGHGGVLRVESEAGRGAAFVVALPREARPTKPAAPRKKKKKQAAADDDAPSASRPTRGGAT
ncbi:MAG TPA: ATP-binding protein, partial [Rubricoccaceae bacterium]